MTLTLGKQVQIARHKAGLTQGQLAAQCGISRFTVQAMEGDRYVPTVENLLRVAAELRAKFEFTVPCCHVPHEKLMVVKAGTR